MDQLDYQFIPCEESLNVQVVFGELRARFKKPHSDLLCNVVQTLQSKFSLLQTQQDCYLMSNVTIFVFKSYLDDINMFLTEQPQHE